MEGEQVKGLGKCLRPTIVELCKLMLPWLNIAILQIQL